MRKYVLAAVTALIVIVLVFAIRQMNKPVPKTQVAKTFHFYPDAVKKVVWATKNKEFKFEREAAQKDWRPRVEGSVMQDKLNALATVQLEKMSTISGGLNVQLQFAADNLWGGQYKNKKFVWSAGIKKGQGFRTDEIWASVFEEGDWAFASRFWPWCDSRVEMILGLLNGNKFLIKEKKGHWIINKGNGDEELDPTTMENWLSVNCRIKVEHYKDLKSFSLNGANEGMLELQFASGKKAKWQKIGPFWQINKKLALESRQLTTAVDQLLSLPVQKK
jgi:hypothetical protein